MIIIGHRGARGLAPENTLAGLLKGIDHGADMLEFDVRVTKDSVPIVHHDRTLTDPDGHKHLIAYKTYAELLAHKADLLTLEKAITSLSPLTILYIEIKPGVITDPVITVIRQQLTEGVLAERIMLGSKGNATLRELHEALPEIAKIVIEPWSGVRATLRARAINTQYISMNQLFLWRPFISPMSRRGWKLMAYTLNNPRKARRWATYGLYGTVTDYPDRFEK